MKLFKTVSIVLIYFSNLNQIRETETTEVTYEELQKLNVTCPPYDTCSQIESTKPDCSCNRLCARYGTCCVDSKYKHLSLPNINVTCRSVNTFETFFMIDQCPQSKDFQSINEDLCRDEWDGQNDIIRLVPVTSLSSNITYKNFYCYRCHEAHDDVLFWDVKLSFNEKSQWNEENALLQLEYDSHLETWVAQLEQHGAIIPVSLSFMAPYEITSILERCRSDVISKCSKDWKEDLVKAKCDAYMALTFIASSGWRRRSLVYRNPHCAICNFKDMNTFSCRPKGGYGGHHGGGGGSYGGGGGSIFRSFSLINILDISPSGGQKIGHIQMCDRAASWDPHFKKCRVAKCIHPGYVVKNDKCAPL